MKRIAKLIAIVLLLLIAVFFIRWGCFLIVGRHRPICPICGKPHLIHNYYRAVGIDQRIEYKDISVTKEIYGEPLYVEDELVLEGYEAHWIILHYDGFSILFQTKDHEKYDYCGFELYSPKMKIRWDIHVGSTREQIVHAYRKCPSINAWKINGETIGDSFCDTGVRNAWTNSLQFTYDENDIVTCIRYLPNF